MNGTSTGDSFDTLGQGADSPSGMTYNGTYFWTTRTAGEIHKYFFNGTYIEKSFDTDSLNSQPYGITQNGTYFWIGDATDEEIYKYWMNGTYTGDHFDTSTVVLRC